MTEMNGSPLAIWDARVPGWWSPQREARMEWLRAMDLPLDTMARLEFFDGYAMMYCYVLGDDGKRVRLGEAQEVRLPLPPREIL